MNIKTAILVKRETDDGAFSINDDVELGTKYLVDIDTIVSAQGYNHVKGFSWTHEIIMVLMRGEENLPFQVSSPSPFPTELLDIDGVEKKEKDSGA